MKRIFASRKKVEEVEMVEMVEEVRAKRRSRYSGIVRVVLVVMVLFLAQASVCPQARKPVSPLLITEVMPDPDPPVGLPPYEFAEWYNPGPDTLNLAGWKWAVGEKAGEARVGKVDTGGEGVSKIGPGEYVIVCGKTAAAALNTFGKVVVVDPFPTLRNSGDRLTLMDPDGRIVHTIYYSSDYYTDALKANGGWSLELADLTSPCSDNAYLPSIDPSGGTPGSVNSVVMKVPAGIPPILLRTGLYGPDLFFCLFSGPLAIDPAVHDYTCLLQPGGLPAETFPSPCYGFPGLFFRIPELADQNQMYSLEIAGSILSCRGEPVITGPVAFSLPIAPDSAGIVINEIMFDPGSGNPEWIELFNRGTVTVDLQKLIIARASPDETVIGFSDQQQWSFLLFPGEYAVMTPSFRQMIRVYPDMDPGSLAERSDFPSLTNDESVLILFDADQHVVDRAIYDPEWHYPYLDETTGVSLERIDPDASGLLQSNWFSASSNYSTISTISTISTSSCTPGRLNSQSLNHTSPSLTTPHFSLLNSHIYVNTLSDPEPIVLHYTFPEAGWFCSLTVFDSRGRVIREVLRLELAGLEGVMTWDGLDREAKQVSDGIYLLVAEYRHPSGKSGRWKRACGVVRVH
ncbi:MAG: lamin tail domain-containing protein [Bacteroidota bacterium]